MNFDEIYNGVKPFTMTTKAKARVLYDSILKTLSVDGDIVEAGIWKGGNIMLIGKVLELSGSDKAIWAYDLFEQTMPNGGKFDVRHDGHPADFSRAGGLATSFKDVVNRYSKYSNYGNVNFVRGDVGDTIPGKSPEKICLLRTDTDLYDSTAHVLKHLFPKLQPGGIMINDDYGYWMGERKAVDELGIKVKLVKHTKMAIYHK